MKTVEQIDSEIQLVENRLFELRKERGAVARAPVRYSCEDCGRETVLHGIAGARHTCWQCGSYRLRHIPG